MAIKMSIRIDLTEDEQGRIKSRVAVGVVSESLPNFAIVDHMLRKIDDTLIEAKTQLVKQCQLQDIQPNVGAPL